VLACQGARLSATKVLACQQPFLSKWLGKNVLKQNQAPIRAGRFLFHNHSTQRSELVSGFQPLEKSCKIRHKLARMLSHVLADPACKE